jgi:hypothetical protein
VRFGAALVSWIPLFFLEGMREMANEPFRWTGAAGRTVFVAATLMLALVCLPRPTNGSWLWPWWGVIAGIGGAAIGIVYLLNGNTTAAWIVLIFGFAVSLDIDFALTDGRTAPARWAIHALLALAVGATAAILTQMESRFAEEEFFIALQAIGLAIFWMLLQMAFGFIVRIFSVQKTSLSGIPLGSRWLVWAAPIGVLTLMILAMRSYQRSFYPQHAPTFPAINADAPFLCSQVAPELQTYPGKEVFQQYLDNLAANPNKGISEYGALALGNREIYWARSFHDRLLAEARQGAFTGATGSVKSVQGEAALRAYYYPRVSAAFPMLFTADEKETLDEWFTAINQRAWTIEGVDWLYALAFSKLPEGPYENQENGAGLLALLETEGLADPALSAKNRAYLARQPRGWTARFRNSDDAVVYQPDWITNAYFQSLGSSTERKNMRQSFEWLLLQALPDGAPLRYNHPEAITLDGISLFAAQQLNDGEYLWLAGRTLDYLNAEGKYAAAQPTVEAALDLTGSSPTVGSCLMYGDSGLPNQIGPLAPDKIVFRDGWAKDSAYLLLNLRFSGWHRYKATNTISLVYQSGALSAENLGGKTFRWLPEGRSLFRDKRIPRENLNGLLIERSGLSAVLYTLSGIGGRWAQDPPYYARVERFESGEEMDYSSTVIENWRGWSQRREISFYHHGPVVVKDTAFGPAKSNGVIAWHFPESQEKSPGRWQLRAGGNPAEALILTGGSIKKTSDGLWVEGMGRIEATTIFLSGEWVGAEVTAEGIHLGEQFIPLRP